MRIRTKAVASFLIAAAIGVLSFVYRFNTLDGALAGFDNDHFPQLVRSIAMLDGERPLRDFADAELRALWPAPTYSTSALAQKVFGRSLRTEALLTIGLLSIGAAGLFLISSRFAGAIVPAAIATLLAVGLKPALYNYPKIVVYVCAASAMLGYARRPTTTRLVLLGLVVAIAALFRHDHGVFLALAAATLLILVHGRAAQRPVVTAGITCAAVLLPGIVLAHIDYGFLRYLRECLQLSRQEAGRTTDSRLHFVVDRSQRLVLHLGPPPPPAARIAVRWMPMSTSETRERAETDLQLTDPIRRAGESNWSYAIADTSVDHLRRIVRDPRVLDTDGIDRTRFVLTSPPPPPPRRWRYELSRWRVAPGIFMSENASPWLYVLAWTIVLCAAVCVAWPPLCAAMGTPGVPLPALRAISVLGVVMLMALLRNPTASRLADVSVPITILGSWLMAAVPRAAHGVARPIRIAIAAGLTVLLVISGSAIAAIADVPHQLEVAGLAGTGGTWRRWSLVWQNLRGLPATLSGIDDDLARASAYLRRCTQPTQRIFVGDNLPELFYFADRRFAAGQLSFFSNFYSSSAQQRAAVERWKHQVVPIVLVQAQPQFDEEFGADYPLLAEYLRAHYRRAANLRVKRGAIMDLWVDRGQSFVPDRESGLPCATSRSPERPSAWD